MAGQITSGVLQIGDDATATKNFVLKVPASPDGTIALYRGNYGAESETLFTVNSATNGSGMAIKGTNSAGTGANAAAGYVGEYMSNTINPTTTGLTSGVAKTITQFDLTAGDWDVGGCADVSSAGGTTLSYMETGVSTTSATLPNVLQRAIAGWPAGYTSVVGEEIAVVPMQRISIAATTTVYLVVQAGFAISTAGVGGILWARRVR